MAMTQQAPVAQRPIASEVRNVSHFCDRVLCTTQSATLTVLQRVCASLYTLVMKFIGSKPGSMLVRKHWSNAQGPTSVASLLLRPLDSRVLQVEEVCGAIEMEGPFTTKTDLPAVHLLDIRGNRPPFHSSSARHGLPEMTQQLRLAAR